MLLFCLTLYELQNAISPNPLLCSWFIHQCGTAEPQIGSEIRRSSTKNGRHPDVVRRGDDDIPHAYSVSAEYLDTISLVQNTMQFAQRNEGLPFWKSSTARVDDIGACYHPGKFACLANFFRCPGKLSKVGRSRQTWQKCWSWGKPHSCLATVSNKSLSMFAYLCLIEAESQCPAAPEQMGQRVQEQNKKLINAQHTCEIRLILVHI